MLKGHIDSVTEDSVNGWAYTSAQNLTGTQILAFDGDSCIGSGEIGHYRHDLEAAGLGDGRYGFAIACDTAALSKAERLNVRLLDSDFMLVQKGVQQSASSNQLADRFKPFTKEEDARIAWMSAQGWLTHEQLLIMRALNAEGFYVRTFSRSELENSSMSDVLTKLMCEAIGAMFRFELQPTELKVTDVKDEVNDLFEKMTALPPERQFMGIFGGGVRKLKLNVCGADTISSSVASKDVVISQFQALILHRCCIADIGELDLHSAKLVFI